MTETLKNLIDRYKQGLLNTPNLQVISKVFSNEVIHFPDDMLVDLTFSGSVLKNSQLTSIKFFNGSFGSSFFNESFLANCAFENVTFQLMKCNKCVFKNCLLINCNFADSYISETIFENCKFEKGCLDSSEFKSCNFINTVFQDWEGLRLGSGVLIDSKFSNSKKSIEFKGEFFFLDLFNPENGIVGMLEN